MVINLLWGEAEIMNLQVYLQNTTILTFLSVVLIVIWGVVSLVNKFEVQNFAFFALAHILMYVDWLIFENDCYFVSSGIVLFVSLLVAIIKLVQAKRFVFSKTLLIYFVLSAIPIIMYILLHDISFLNLRH